MITRPIDTILPTAQYWLRNVSSARRAEGVGRIGALPGSAEGDQKYAMKFLTIPSACLSVLHILWAKRLVYMSVAAAIVLVVSIGEAAAQSKRVLLLHSHQPNFQFWSEYGEAIRIELRRQSPWPLEIIDHTLLPAASGDENPEGPLAEYLNALYARRPPDLIISIGAPATSFAQRHRQQIFSTMPLLITAVEQRRIQHASLTEYDMVVATMPDYRAL